MNTELNSLLKIPTLKGDCGFLKPFKHLSCRPHADITSCSVFACIRTYPFLTAIVVLSRKDAEEEE